MLSNNRRRGQSIVEYAILLGIIMAGILIMQVFVKRGFQGGLKDASDKLGDQFSAGGTTISQESNLTEKQTVTEEVATTADTTKGIGAYVNNLKATVDNNAYSYSNRTAAKQEVISKTSTDSATAEKFGWTEHQNDKVDNFSSPFINKEVE